MATKTASNLAITLFRGFDRPGQYTWSAFVTKLEARLRFDRVPYKNAIGGRAQAPRGKVPYITIVEQNPHHESTISDSTLIIQGFIENGVLKDINADLSATEKAFDLSLRGMLEERLYWYHGYEKWHDNYYEMRDHVMASIPYYLRVVIGLLAYRGSMQTLQGQGTSRFTPEELKSFKQKIWGTLDAMLAESKKTAGSDGVFWALGQGHPTEADASLFACVISSLVTTAGPETKSIVQRLPNIMEYARRIHNRYFPDYESVF